jgi:MFS family permease
VRVVSRPYYGWAVLLVAAAAMVGTLPGRTQGLGLVTEPLLSEFGVDRVGWARINFWATLVGSTFALFIGRFVDRFGSRIVLTLTSLALGVIVFAMSATTSLMLMVVFVALTRGVGQSALSVVSLALVGQWFTRRLSIAMGVYALVMSIGFMIAFPVVGSIVQTRGWRTAWLYIGIALLALLTPLSWAIVRRSPESIGLTGDGESSDGRAPALEGWPWQAAIRTPAFWLFAIGSSLYGLVASGIGLFNESILAERGFNASVYYQTLVVTAMMALVGNFAGGVIAERWPMPRLMCAAMAILAAGLAALPLISSVPQVMVWAAAMGIGGGFVMVLFFGFWARAYGRRHLGRIQGIAQAMTVLASAVGPVLLAQWVAWTGSYGSMFTMLAAVVALNGIAALAVTMPTPELSPARVVLL